MNPLVRSSQILSSAPLTSPAPAAASPSPYGSNPYNNTGNLLTDPKKNKNNPLFTGYGFDPTGDNENVAEMKRLSMGMYPGMAAGVGFFNQLEPLREQGITSALRVFDPTADTQAKIDAERNRNNDLARTQMARDAQTMAEQGYGSGATEGMMRGDQQAADQNTLDYADQFQDPEYLAKMYDAYLGTIGQGQQIPGLDALLGMAGPINNWTQFRKQNQQQGGLLSGVTGLLGSAAGAYFNGTGPFKKGGK